MYIPHKHMVARYSKCIMKWGFSITWPSFAQVFNMENKEFLDTSPKTDNVMTRKKKKKKQKAGRDEIWSCTH